MIVYMEFEPRYLGLLRKKNIFAGRLAGNPCFHATQKRHLQSSFCVLACLPAARASHARHEREAPQSGGMGRRPPAQTDQSPAWPDLTTNLDIPLARDIRSHLMRMLNQPIEAAIP